MVPRIGDQHQCADNASVCHRRSATSDLRRHTLELEAMLRVLTASDHVAVDTESNSLHAYRERSA